MVALRGSADGGRDTRQYGAYRCRVPGTSLRTSRWRGANHSTWPARILPGAGILRLYATCVNSRETAVAPLVTMGYFRDVIQRQGKSVPLKWPTYVFFALALVVAGLGSPSAFAERGYYKWVDSRGNPQHSDRPPPPGVEYEFISTETGFRRRVTKEEASQGGSSAPAMPAAPRPTPTAAEQQVAIEKNPELCDRAKANLDTLNSNARVRIRDGDDIRYLTDEEKEVQRQKAQDLIAVHCNS